MFPRNPLLLTLAIGVASLAIALQATPAHAQPAPTTTVTVQPTGPPPPPANAPGTWLDVEVGQSFIFKETRAIGRVLVSDNEVAEIKLLEQGQFQIRGANVGSTDVWVWFRDDMANPVSYELTVHNDLSELIRRIDHVVDGTPPRVYPLQDRLAIDGAVPDVETLEQVAALASVYDPDFVNLMSVAGDHQIQIEVVFAEVNRTALREMGLNGVWGTNSLAFGMEGPNSAASGYVLKEALSDVSSGAVLAPAAGTFTMLGTVERGINLNAILGVMESNSITKVMAKPTLVALSGQQAEFLAGGEVPIPVAQFGDRISLEFKEYGVKLLFVPTVLGQDIIDARVYIEVSDIDSANAIRLTGIEIPGFLVRKSDSHLRIESGKTFAMAGILHDNLRATYAKVPILGDIPIIGSLFRYVQHRRTETELMIFVTPRLVRPMSADELPTLPGASEDNNPNDFELFMLGLDHRVGSRSEESTSEPNGPVGLER